MKTIEERARAFACKVSTPGCPSWAMFLTMITNALTELAADLQSEKEKELEQAASNWQDTVSRFSNGLEFYRGIVRQIGEMFGEAAKTSDDGSVQDDVLALKVPELVDELIAKASEKEKELAELRETRDDLEARLGAIERSHNCDGDGCAVCYELSRLPDRSSLLDEVKRVLENVRGFEIIGERTRSKIDQLLTRLGGSHE